MVKGKEVGLPVDQLVTHVAIGVVAIGCAVAVRHKDKTQGRVGVEPLPTDCQVHPVEFGVAVAIVQDRRPFGLDARGRAPHRDVDVVHQYVALAAGVAAIVVEDYLHLVAPGQRQGEGIILPGCAVDRGRGPPFDPIDNHLEDRPDIATALASRRMHHDAAVSRTALPQLAPLDRMGVGAVFGCGVGLCWLICSILAWKTLTNMKLHRACQFSECQCRLLTARK
jgi:hypothetical protein